MLTKTLILSGVAIVAFNAVTLPAMQEVGVEPIIQWIVGQAGMGGLAAFAMLMLNKSWKDRIASEQKHAEEERQRTESMNSLRSDTLVALQANTEAMTRLCERLE